MAVLPAVLALRALMVYCKVRFDLLFPLDLAAALLPLRARLRPALAIQPVPHARNP
ncbi:MAG TPA: hypothetical protein PKM88_11385 [bacterium]|nr:hypothetical protein [bacterium]